MKLFINLIHRPFKWFKNASLIKKILFLGCIILLIFIVYPFLNPPKRPLYSMTMVSRDTLVEQVDETGNVETAGTVDIYSPTTGIVTETYAQNGDTVVANQQLMKIRAVATEQEKTAAYANYLSAKSALNIAQTKLFNLKSTMFDNWKKFMDIAQNSTYQNSDKTPNTTNRTLPEFTISQNNWLAAEGGVKDQETVIAQAQAEFANKSLAYQATQDTIIKATTNGTIANMTTATGELVTAATTGNGIFKIINSNKVIVKVAVNEIDIVKIKEKQKAIVSFDAFRDKKFDAIVERIDTVGTNTSSVISYNVYLTLTNPDPAIRSQMTATVTIETSRKENVLTVPNNAVKPYKGGKAVQIIDRKTRQLVYVPIKIGAVGITKTEVISGIKEGTRIVTSQATSFSSQASPQPTGTVQQSQSTPTSPRQGSNGGGGIFRIFRGR